MTQVKMFSSRIVDEFGGEFPNAIVAVRAFSETSQTTGTSESGDSEYSLSSDLASITYKVSYWYTEQTKQAGKRSRPLIHEDGEAPSDVFVVDLEAPELSSLLNSTIEHNDKILRIIESDAIRRFN